MSAEVDLSAFSDPVAAAALFAIDPAGFGGLNLRTRAGPARDRWLAGLRTLLDPAAPVRRMPSSVPDGRLFGGLDIAATLAAGRPVADRGLLAEAGGGIVLVSMAERMPTSRAARLVLAIETGGAADRAGSTPMGVGLLALDEGVEDEALPPILAERLSFWVRLEDWNPGEAWPAPSQIADARRLYRSVPIADREVASLTEVAASLGIGSLAAPIMAARAARAAAALGGRDAVAMEDAILAARLVLAPRATRVPAGPEPDGEPEQEEQPEGRPEPAPDSSESREPEGADATDVVLAAAKAALPPNLLAQLDAALAARLARTAPGKGGGEDAGTARGRPVGVRRGSLGDGTRLNVIETLRAAAPWQKLRIDPASAQTRRVRIRRDDLRFTRYRQRTETTTIFVVDASGSLAANRLAEAKGAVELLLADCYIRRDQVALMAFRGQGADLLLPPTRSLARAKRCLAELPGGGGTPLASAIEAAALLADQIRRRGPRPILVFITDGRANVARDGTAGRAGAEADAHRAARAAAAAGLNMLVVDAAPRPQTTARDLARNLKALYLPLPRAEAATLSAAIRAVAV